MSKDGSSMTIYPLTDKIVQAWQELSLPGNLKERKDNVGAL
jgi:hypothetical protein